MLVVHVLTVYNRSRLLSIYILCYCRRQHVWKHANNHYKKRTQIYPKHERLRETLG